MGGLEAHLLARLDQAVFKVQNPQSGAQTRFELLGVEWLR